METINVVNEDLLQYGIPFYTRSQFIENNSMLW
jgi:hypothetical protein